MAATLALVEVEPDIDHLQPDSPLAGMARRRFGGKSLLEWVVRRVSESQRISGIVVIAGSDPFSRRLCEVCPPDAKVLICEATDRLGRLAEASAALQCEGIVRLNISRPFVDPDLIDRLIAAAGNAAAGSAACDYAGFSFTDGTPVVRSQLGIAAEWCSAHALARADRLAKRPEDRAASTNFLHSRPDLFELLLISLPPRLDRDDLRLAIHDEEDWEELQVIFDALGPESLDWQYIAALVDRQPTMRARMARRNRLSAQPC
jgi:spore coat polysaccharide biosynthesis protein SpsF (cytidylyltransferase family)